MHVLVALPGLCHEDMFEALLLCRLAYAIRGLLPMWENRFAIPLPGRPPGAAALAANALRLATCAQEMSLCSSEFAAPGGARLCGSASGAADWWRLPVAAAVSAGVERDSPSRLAGAASERNETVRTAPEFEALEGRPDLEALDGRSGRRFASSVPDEPAHKAFELWPFVNAAVPEVLRGDDNSAAEKLLSLACICRTSPRKPSIIWF